MRTSWDYGKTGCCAEELIIIIIVITVVGAQRSTDTAR